MTTIGLMGGTALGTFEGLVQTGEHSFDTPYGPPSSPVLEFRAGDHRVLFIARHGRGHHIPPHQVNYRANVAALKALGAEALVSVSAVGSLREEICPGDVVICDQYLDFTKNRGSTFFDQGIVAHVNFADPVCPELARAGFIAATRAGARTHAGGTYVCIEGPQFSTRAESRLYRSYGAHVIGMTALPEAKLAREAELPYVTFALATDYDSWRDNESVSVTDVLSVLKSNAALARQIVLSLLQTFPPLDPSPARTALDSALIGVTRDQLPPELAWIARRPAPRSVAPVSTAPSVRPSAPAAAQPSAPPSAPVSVAPRASSAPISAATPVSAAAPVSAPPSAPTGPAVPVSVAPRASGPAPGSTPAHVSTPPASGSTPAHVSTPPASGSTPAHVSTPPGVSSPPPASVAPVSSASAPSSARAVSSVSQEGPEPTEKAPHSVKAPMSNTDRTPVLVIGSMALDDLILPSGSFPNVVGGAATFASVAAALFNPARIVAVVGEDFPPAVLAELERRNVETSGIVRLPGKTFKWTGKYASDLSSRETLDTQLNVFADFRPVLPPEFKKSRFVLLGNIHPALQLEVLDQLEPGAFVAADTMNFWIEGERATLDRLLRRIDCLIINDEELRLLAGTYNLRRAAQLVLGMGPKRLIVKKGEHGALLFTGDRINFVPAYPLEVEIDPTGAGDSFAGALLGRLAEIGGADDAALRLALPYATAVASFCVEGVGLNRLSEISRGDIDARLHELSRMVQLES